MRTFILMFIFILSIIMGCNDDDSEMTQFNLDNQIYLKITNQSGQNLFDETTEGSYNIVNLKLFYLVNNEAVEVTLENGYNMGSIELTSNKLLKVLTNFSTTNIVNETSEYKTIENIAFLKLTETDTDTIKTHSKSNRGYFLVSKVWYNDELVWNSEDRGIIEIVKKQ